MNKGWIKLHSKMLSWGWMNIPEMVALWVHILLSANYKEMEWHGEKFEAGSFPTSIDKLAKETGLSPRTVRTCINRLKSTNEITIKATNKGTKIIVNKWEEYQGRYDDTDMPNDMQSDIQVTSNRQTNDKQVTTIKEDKNIRRQEDKNISVNAEGKPAEKPFQKPSLDEVRNYCIANGYSEIDAERFISYYEKNDWTVKDKNGSRRKMKNWKLCLNSWVINEIRYNQTNDLRNKAREAYIRDVEIKERNSNKGVEWFE